MGDINIGIVGPKIEPTIPFTGYNNILKTQWRKGNLPTVKIGFYGDPIKQDTVSLEHLKPHSQGGKTCLSNLVLASRRNNSSRGTKPLKEVVDIEVVKAYLRQFINVNIKGLNGVKYIRDIIKTLNKLGVHLE